jgi:hypothetical protein
MKCLNKAVASLVIVTSCLTIFVSRADERLWLETKINDKRARLFFDSGSSEIMLFRGGAQRLGLKVIELSTNDALSIGRVLGVTPFGNSEVSPYLSNSLWQNGA